MLFGIRGPIVTRPIDAPDAKATSRFPITEFGIKAGMISTIRAMKAAEAKGTLHVKYEGIEALEKVGNRPCYKLVRTPYDPPEEDNIMKLTIWIDVDTLMQVGSDLIDVEGNLIAEYYFRDIELNPKFDEKQFTRGAL
jgi:outer membrane lipoprotein-sorting protein